MVHNPEVIVRVNAKRINTNSCMFIIEEEIDCITHMRKFNFNLEYMFEYITEECYELFIKNILGKFLQLEVEFELIYDVPNSDFKLFLQHLKNIALK